MPVPAFTPIVSVTRRRMPDDYLVVLDCGLAQHFLLSRAFAAALLPMMPGALVFERVADAAVGVHQGEIDALDVSAVLSYITDNVSRRADC